MAAMDKYKYMPLSEANLKPAMVSAFDGQNLYVASSSHQPAAASPSPFASLAPTTAEPKLEVRYSMGNYLGGGIAGVVNEAFDKAHQRQVAIKMLNPVGYKLLTPSVLRRAEIIKKGVPLNGPHRLISREHVYWVKVTGKKELVACYADGRMTPAGCVVTPAMLKELTLEMCVALWGLDADENDDDDDVIDDMDASQPRREENSGHRTNNANDRGESELSESQPQHYSLNGREEMKGSGGTADDDMMMMMLHEEDEDTDRLLLPRRSEQVQVGDVVYTLPSLPAKYKTFLQGRRSIYREIAHMHKLTGNSISGHVAHGGHENVLKLYDVLEYVQPSKSTIFLVLELAAGGELFDRIRSDNGVDESVARGYFTQLLSGVLFCHQLGIVHRDLKPENLLLSDTDVLKIADFGLSAHFIAAVSSGADDGRSDVLPELDDNDAIGRSTSSIMIPAAARFRRLNSIVGSPHYVAPEILQNARYGYDGRKADMWSVGVILYGLLAGSLPFGKELPTCPRYLKFCEWIRSLPCDPQTGKLVFDASIYQSTAAPVRIPSTPVDVTAEDPSSNFRLAQVHPNCQPLSSSSSSWWLHNGQPPIKPHDSLSASSNLLANGASSSRRGSRVVSFPTWLFPSKLTPQAVFLMASLLHPEPGKRFACEDACRSAWVNGTTH